MSKKQSGPLQVLIVDDKKEFVDDLQLNANPHRIRLVHAGNLEEGVQKLNERGESEFDGIILDVICLKEKNQKIPDQSFISKAIDVFSRKAPSIPKVILTAETSQAETLKPYYEGTHRIFLKGKDDIDEMFKYFVRESNKKEERFIATKYYDIFEIFEKKYLDKTAKQELISCLLNTNSSDLHTMKGTLSCLRILQEKMFVALNKYDDQMVPVEYVSNEENNQIRVNFASILHHLKGKYDNTSRIHLGKIYIPHDSTIDRFMQFVYKTSSEGIHAIDENISNKPTKYTVQAVTYALLDLLLWFKTVCDGKTM